MILKIYEVLLDCDYAVTESFLSFLPSEHKQIFPPPDKTLRKMQRVHDLFTFHSNDEVLSLRKGVQYVKANNAMLKTA